MKQLFTTTFLLIVFFHSYGQDSIATRLEPWMVKMYFIPLSINFEGRISDSFGIDIGTGVNAGWGIGDDGQFNYVVYPNINLMLKNYYNLEKRQKKGKRTAMNSGNYWGVYSKFAFAPIAENYQNDYKWGLIIAPVWGFQRSYGSQITLGGNIGYGINLDNTESRLSPLLNLHLGFVLAK